MREEKKDDLDSFGLTLAANKTFVPLASVVVAPYIEPYGFAALDARSWKVKPGTSTIGVDGQLVVAGAVFSFDVEGHDDVEGHTWYIITCNLNSRHGKVLLTWHTRRRLAQLREYLHGVVKSELEGAYVENFAATPFAHHGGPPGTTARLRTWLSTLAGCINTGIAPPSIVALVLHFLDAPELLNPLITHTEDTAVRTAAVAPNAEGRGNDTLCKPDTRLLGPDSGVFEDIGLIMDTDGEKELVLGFRTPRGSEHVLNFGQREPPMGIVVSRSIPMVVTRIAAFSHAEHLGIQIGWELICVNGTRLHGHSVKEAISKLFGALALQPHDPSKASGLDSKCATIVIRKQSVPAQV